MSERPVAEEGLLKLHRNGPVLFVALHRPRKRNALNDRAVLELEACFAGLDPQVRAVVLYGTGDHFCAGLDLSELSERDVAEGIAHSSMWHRAFQRIEFGAVPVVAVLHGAVIGGGLELAAACHIRIAEEGAYYALPEGQRGIFVGGGGSVRLPRLIGAARMADMMLTGRTYDAAEGERVGFSQYLVRRGEGLAKARLVAEAIAANAPITNFAVVQALPRIAAADPATGYMMESLVSAIAQNEPEAKARIRDFLAGKAKKTTV
ncbi:crotonase/enoyl-CoA hydratase family protein [Afifella sp. IM 167]|uniref:crotonase/enoyl-CoA hydratase family protein n=1 Tax=Afifella sp. IM 167 TaxID=2033586 RepID=UPI001CCE14A5|nr:crotonase/enoyl-CoA hydratase family protein [Afifella sp. IM 167]